MRTALLLALALAAAPDVALAQLAPEASPPPQAGPPMAAPETAPAAGAPVAAPEAGAVPPGAVPPPAPRNGPYVGFSFGTGRGDVTLGGETVAVGDLVPGASPTTLALMLRCGWASGPFLFGLQANVIRSSWSAGGSTATMQLTGVDVVATWAPPELGMYARLGVGPAQLSFDGGGAASDSYGGAEAMLGVGMTMGGLGVGIDYIVHTYDEGAPFDGASYLLATISLDLG